MDSTRTMPQPPRPSRRPSAQTDDRGEPSIDQLAAPVRRAIARTRRWLLEHQLDEGCWCAELEGDTILESETILLLAFLGRERGELARRLADYLLARQLPEGGWAMYPGGALEVSGSVKAYFALKLLGHDGGEEPMQRARRAILARGGADTVNSYTRFFLAMLGQISYDHCPAVPPEAVLLPDWFPVNLYKVSSWSRTIIVPLSIVSALRPVRPIEPARGIRELFLREPKDWPPLRAPGLKGATGPLSWDRFFRAIDAALKFCQRHGLTPLRRQALDRAKSWMLERFEHSDGLGAIYPPIVWSIVALKAMGYPEDGPEVSECLKQLDALVIEDDRAPGARVQPCKSPVWDTAIALRALTASGARPDRPELRRAVEWLLDNEVRLRGDWARTVDAPPGGWAFEYRNAFYPDNDDTAMVLMALKAQFAELPAAALPPELRCVAGETDLAAADSTGDAPPRASGAEGDTQDDSLAAESEHAARLARSAQAIDRALGWMLAMQNRDGGWGAFDRDNDREFLCHVPFADHNAMIDPSTPDLTGRVLEALGHLGYRIGSRPVDRAVAYLRRTQEADGSWFGRWGVNYIYGTWQALSGLVAVGVPKDDPAVAAGARWLLAHQQPCGAWGESPDSYEQPELRGQGPPTASQTAWALLGLVAAGLSLHPAVARGVRWLLDTQRDDGTWHEEEFTGTGFPRVFYLRYHYYPISFPLMALAAWAIESQHGGAPSEAVAALRVVCRD